MNIINNYKVYIHTNLVNGKKYVGITQQAEKERWSNGNGYRENKKFYKDIQKYGWNNGFSHEIIKENNETAVKGTTKMAVFDYEKKKIARIPKEFLEKAVNINEK